MRKKNLTYKSHMVVGVHKLCEYSSFIYVEHGRRTVNENTVHILKKRITNDAMITHEIHLSNKSIQSSVNDLQNPSTDVGLLLWFGGASAINRPSNSKCIVHDSNIYYIVTWTDLLGSKHQKRSELTRKKDNKLIYFLQQESNETYQALIFDLIKTFSIL